MPWSAPEDLTDQHARIHQARDRDAERRDQAELLVSDVVFQRREQLELRLRSRRLCPGGCGRVLRQGQARPGEGNAQHRHPDQVSPSKHCNSPHGCRWWYVLPGDAKPVASHPCRHECPGLGRRRTRFQERIRHNRTHKRKSLVVVKLVLKRRSIQELHFVVETSWRI